jgi:hypothetical protein
MGVCTICCTYIHCAHTVILVALYGFFSRTALVTAVLVTTHLIVDMGAVRKPKLDKNHSHLQEKTSPPPPPPMKTVDSEVFEPTTPDDFADAVVFAPSPAVTNKAENRATEVRAQALPYASEEEGVLQELLQPSGEAQAA